MRVCPRCRRMRPCKRHGVGWRRRRFRCSEEAEQAGGEKGERGGLRGLHRRNGNQAGVDREEFEGIAALEPKDGAYTRGGTVARCP